MKVAIFNNSHKVDLEKGQVIIDLSETEAIRLINRLSEQLLRDKIPCRFLRKYDESNSISIDVVKEK